ncbi:MAG: RHS repeat-associated core domain-containing protein [Chitinophagales bacterium]
MDYAYTIHGWLKGVNSSALNSNKDMGRDGDSGPHKFVGTDAMGFILDYYEGDYSPINTGVASFIATPTTSGGYNFITPDLFNGNIRAMSTALMRTSTSPGGAQDKVDILGKAYEYDQLNRLETSYSYLKVDMETTGNFTWVGGSSTDKWATNYTYDGNGNIMTMKRAGYTAASAYDMDDMTYHYINGTNQLEYVDDAASGTYTGDISDQTTGNYAYDAIGNLIFDYNEGDELAISWNVYGKIRTITKNGNPFLEFAYDPMGNRIMKLFHDSGQDEYTYYFRDAQGNVLATYIRTDDGDVDEINLKEQHIYGSARLGYVEFDPERDLPSTNYYERWLGDKRYELTNHLGNVLSVISDRRLPYQDGTSGIVLYYEPDVIAAQDYDPFGMITVGRNWDVGSGYRYGFNGKEQDDEVSGNGNQYDYGFRIYNPSIGRFLSVDPLTNRYSYLTPYQFASNTPIIAIDLDGLEAVIVNIRPVPGYPELTQVNVIKISSSVQQPTLQITYNYYDATGALISTRPATVFVPGSVEEQLATSTDANGVSGLDRLTAITPNSAAPYTPGWAASFNASQDPLTIVGEKTALNGFQYDLNIEFKSGKFTLDKDGLAPSNSTSEVQSVLSKAATTLLGPTILVTGIAGQPSNIKIDTWTLTVVGETDGQASNHKPVTEGNDQPIGNAALAQDRANTIAVSLKAMMSGRTINTAIQTNSGGESQEKRNSHINVTSN